MSKINLYQSILYMYYIFHYLYFFYIFGRSDNFINEYLELDKDCTSKTNIEYENTIKEDNDDFYLKFWDIKE